MEARQERLLTIPIVFAIALAALAGTATVFYQTRIANPSVEEYFSFINVGRLLIITHVHLFGYATMGFILWTLGRRLGAAQDARFGIVIGLATLAGTIDVISWWGVIYISPIFRFLTFAMGGAFVAGIFLASWIVLRRAIGKGPIS